MVIIAIMVTMVITTEGMGDQCLKHLLIHQDIKNQFLQLQRFAVRIITKIKYFETWFIQIIFIHLVNDQNCVSPDVQNSLYGCFVDQNGTTIQAMEKFQQCTSKNSDGCDNKSLQQLQTCVLNIGKNNPVPVPPEATTCIQKNLSLNNLNCMEKTFPSLQNLLPLKPSPNVAANSPNMAPKPKNPLG